MSIRKIVVVSTTRTTPVVLNSSAETWGELQDALVGQFGNVSALRAVVKETKNDLTSNDAVLPEGDFTLFLAPKQIKAGVGTDIVSVLEALKDKWISAIDEVIEEIEEGDHGGTVSGIGSGTTSISSEDRRALEQIMKGL